jgi:hypothetical protein
MIDYVKKTENNKIIFKNNLDNTKLIVIHNDDENIYDPLFINDKYDLNFIDYVIKELKKTKDIFVIFSLVNSLKIENLLKENQFKILNYQYNIKFRNYSKICGYDISSNLDDEGKYFYLKNLNKINKSNNEYLSSNKKYDEFNENWFKNKEFEYRIYKKNGKVVGIVDYKIFDNDSNNINKTNEVFNCNNKLCIRCLLSDNKLVIEDIIKDLLNTYKKDIIIHSTYNEKDLKDVLVKLKSNFDFCQYILVEDNY